MLVSLSVHNYLIQAALTRLGGGLGGVMGAIKAVGVDC